MPVPPQPKFRTLDQLVQIIVVQRVARLKKVDAAAASLQVNRMTVYKTLKRAGVRPLEIRRNPDKYLKPSP